MNPQHHDYPGLNGAPTDSSPTLGSNHWVNDDIVPFVWMLNGKTGQVVRVNHKAHIERLMHDESGRILSDNEAERALQLQEIAQAQSRAAMRNTPPAEPIVLTVAGMDFTQTQLDGLRAALGLDTTPAAPLTSASAPAEDIPAPAPAAHRIESNGHTFVTNAPPAKRSHHKKPA